jgi:hypothetical protein
MAVWIGAPDGSARLQDFRYHGPTLRRAALLGCLLVGLGCAPDVPAVHPVVQMAVFDLQCPRAELHYYKINDQTWGVRGCGKQTKYVEVCRSLNNPSMVREEECQWVQN